MEEINEQRAERLNRVKIVEKEKDSLEGKKEEAVDFLVKENQLTIERSKLYQLCIFDLSEACAASEKIIVSSCFSSRFSGEGSCLNINIILIF